MKTSRQNLKISGIIFASTLFIVLLSGCLKNDDKLLNTSSSKASSSSGKEENEEDCDDKKAKETIEKIKTEEFSLNKANDAGCAVEDTSKKSDPLLQPTTK